MRKINYLHAGKIYSGTLENGVIIRQSGNHHADISISRVQLLPPVIKPGKIICVGLNYPPLEKGEPWISPPYPVLFHKAASSLIGFGSTIVLPKISQQVLYEGELAVIIGTRGKNITVDQALKFVAGYTIANDVGAPDVESRCSQWASGKMFDTFCPLGPTMVTPEDILDPGRLFIKTILNGDVVQDSRHRRDLDDFQVAGVGELRHQEGAGPHDRRHQLPSGTRCGLHSTGHMCRIAYPLHHRDGEGTGRHYVANCGPGDRTHKAAGDHRSLGRTATEAAGQGIGQVDEEIAAAGRLQKGAKQHEDKDEGRRHAKRDAEDPFGRQPEGGGHTFDAITLVDDQVRHIRAEIGIKQK